MTEQDSLLAALKKEYGLNADDADSVLAYAVFLSKTEKSDKITNEYAVAKALNDVVYEILRTISTTYKDRLFDSSEVDIQPLNKSYILLVSELKKIYSWNVKLQEIKPEPVWVWLDTLEGREWELVEQDSMGNSSDLGKGHIAQVNKLNIIEGTDKPQYTPVLQKLIDEAELSVRDFNKLLIIDKKTDEYSPSKAKRNWFIDRYTIEHRPDGTILINGVLRLKKTQAGQAPERLMEQAVRQPNTLFKPNLGQTKRNISTVISSMGFTPVLRDLFFPTISQTKGVVFRHTIDHATVVTERIDTYELDSELEELGATTTQKPVDLSEIPF